MEDFLKSYKLKEKNSLAAHKKKILKMEDDMVPIYKQQRPENKAWTGYQSDSPSAEEEREEFNSDSDSREDFQSEEEEEAPQVVIRDSTGQIITGKKTQKEINEERMAEWKSGIVQKRRMQEKEEEDKRNLPLTRYEIDEDADLHFKAKKRFGDPLEEYKPSKSIKSGFEWDNRFNIPPGKQWDGIDRTNGFERRYIERQGVKNYQNHLAYKQFAREL